MFCEQFITILVYKLDIVVIFLPVLGGHLCIWLSSSGEIYLPGSLCLADYKSSSSSLCTSFSYSACSHHKLPGRGLREGFCWVSVHYLSMFPTGFTHFNSLLSSLKGLWLMKRLLLGSVDWQNTQFHWSFPFLLLDRAIYHMSQQVADELKNEMQHFSFFFPLINSAKNK